MTGPIILLTIWLVGIPVTCVCALWWHKRSSAARQRPDLVRFERGMICSVSLMWPLAVPIVAVILLVLSTSKDP